MDLYYRRLGSSKLLQSKYVIVLHSDLLSQVVHFDEPPFFSQKFSRVENAGMTQAEAGCLFNISVCIS